MKRKIDWLTGIFLVLTHTIGFVGTSVYVYYHGIHPLEVVLFAVLYIATGLGITAGYHRYFSHRSYDSHPLLKFFYLIFGACALENSVLRWASDHRIHHKYVDTDLDPYNIKRGGFYAHMGWIFYKSQRNRDNVSDLQNDPLVVWQERYYIPIAVVVGFLIPALIGMTVGRPWGALLWGGFFRVAFVHHATFFINSLAHMVGKQTYSDQDSSRDNWWIAFLTYGEGYHNFHHKFQADYRNGIRWYQWDPSKWLIAVCQKFNLAGRLNQTPPQKILEAKLAMDMIHVQKKFEWVQPEFWEKMRVHLEERRLHLKTAYESWLADRSRYEKIRILKMTKSRHMIRRWKQRLKARERKFEYAKQDWREALEFVAMKMKGFSNLPASKI